ncbi:MAG: hypothetical protein AB7V14_09600 [Kiritimatiellia bacterium]
MNPQTPEEIEFGKRLDRDAAGRAAANVQDRYMVTRREIQQRLAATGRTITIPKGTPCKPIRNGRGPLCYRVNPWRGISNAELAALQTMGLEVPAEDVENSRGDA